MKRRISLPVVEGKIVEYGLFVRRICGDFVDITKDVASGEGVLELTEDAGPDGGVGGGEHHAASEAAEDGVARVGGMAARVAGGGKDVAEEGEEAFEIGGRGWGF